MVSCRYWSSFNHSWSWCILYVGRITIIQYLSTIHVHRLAISQVKMLHNFSKVLGIVFALVGILCIVLALDRLGLRRAARRMAVYIRDSEGQSE